MKIEIMSAGDLAAVTRLAEQLGYPNKLEDIELRFRSIQGSPDYALFVAKNTFGKVIGYIQINREIHTLVASPRAEVAALVVDQNERSKGIGTALLKHAEGWAKNENLGLIRVRSNVKRTDAHRFYQRNGYEIPKSWHLFTKNIE